MSETAPTVDVLIPGGGVLKVPEDMVANVQHLSDLAARPDTVHQAIAKVMAAMPAVGKDDRGPAAQGGYAYRGIEAVTAALQKLCGEHGVVIWPQARLVDAQEAVGMQKGWFDWRVEVTWGVAGPDGGLLEPAPITIGIGRDNTDKGVNKAMTQAYKYLLLQLFMVADGGQGQHDADGMDYESGRQAPGTATGPALLGGEKAREIAASIASLTEDQRAWLAKSWTAEDPMTGDPYLPTADGKPALRFVLADHELAVRGLIAQAARQKSDGVPAEAPGSPQNGPGEDPAVTGPDDPSAATEGHLPEDGQAGD